MHMFWNDFDYDLIIKLVICSQTHFEHKNPLGFSSVLSMREHGKTTNSV